MPVKIKGIVEGALRNVFALGFVSFFTDVSSEMVFSLLPAFILGLPNSNRAALGFIEGVAEALSYSLRAVSGLFSDKFRNRKLIVFIGYALSNIAKPFFAVVQTVNDAFIIRVTDRMGKAIRTSPRDALLSESVTRERRGLAFGIHRTLDQTGAILGPILASMALLFWGLSIGDVFILSLIPGSLALMVLVFFVQERRSHSVAGFHVLPEIQQVLTGPFIRLLLIVAVFSMGAFNFSFILLNAQEAGVTDALLPIIYALVNVTHMVIAIPIGVVSDHIGKEWGLIIGYGSFLATTLTMLLLPHTVNSAIVVALVYGLYLGIVETVQRALVLDYTQDALRGTAYGVYYLVVGSAFLIANFIVGTLWEFYGSSTAIVYSLTTSSIAMISLIVFIKLKAG